MGRNQTDTFKKTVRQMDEMAKETEEGKSLEPAKRKGVPLKRLGIISSLPRTNSRVARSKDEDRVVGAERLRLRGLRKKEIKEEGQRMQK